MTETARQARAAANDRVVVCVAGVRGRGGSLLSTFAAQPDVEVKYVCDLDAGVLQSRAGQVKDIRGRAPQTITDYRQALEDDSVDALVLGTPDHWHALPSIHACQAGKDVYVEKPVSHNIWEGRKMVEAARKYNRIVQGGTQQRSDDLQAELKEYLDSGELGK
ncbi:MAG: Gfo/Idh/MocA family oxidoreductase, partial [Planctomycetales bacterium]|nr:Gfo/Idh/MocA family oxidoreductase [Planctomycetales bacterium]